MDNLLIKNLAEYVHSHGIFAGTIEKIVTLTIGHRTPEEKAKTYAIMRELLGDLERNAAAGVAQELTKKNAG